MAWRFVQQPNGLLARWSDVVDDFTDYDLIDGEAMEVALAYCDRDAARLKIAWARLDATEILDESRPPDGLRRFRECIGIISVIHGPQAAASREIEMCKPLVAKGQ